MDSSRHFHGDRPGPGFRRTGRLVSGRPWSRSRMAGSGGVLHADHAGGEAVLALAIDHPDRISDRPGMGWTPNLAVDDLDDMVGRLRGQGVQFDAEEEGADEGYRLVRVRDPEGNA